VKVRLPLIISEQESGRVPYTVQVCLDGTKLAASVSEIWEWLDRRQVEPPVFRYRMTTEDIVLRLDFKTLSDAATFGEAFRGAVLGVT
jgi:hypothetical protein